MIKTDSSLAVLSLFFIKKFDQFLPVLLHKRARLLNTVDRNQNYEIYNNLFKLNKQHDRSHAALTKMNKHLKLYHVILQLTLGSEHASLLYG